MKAAIIYASVHKSLLNFFREFTLGEDQKLFIVYTCTLRYMDYEKKAISGIGEDKKAKYIGSFWCKGFNTFGPFGWFGGVAKGHSDDTDLANARKYIDELVK